MLLIVGIVAVLALAFVPQWWVRTVFSAHQEDREEYPGSGGELARHMIESLKIENASVIESDSDNHFDPENKVVALTAMNLKGKSLTAVTIAAHEIGHLIQLEQGNIWLSLRTALVKLTQNIQRTGAIALFLMPFAGLLTRSPLVMIAMLGVGLAGVVLNVIVHLVTLPMELDASFGKALPLLVEGGFVDKKDEPNVRKILWAAAFTYLASALSSLLNLANWLRILRR